MPPPTPVQGQQHHPGNPFVHSNDAVSPPLEKPMPGLAPGVGVGGADIHQYVSPYVQHAYIQPSSTTATAHDMSEDLLFSTGAAANVVLPSSPTASVASSAASDASALSLDYAEFDAEGLSTLERIYLFSRSRASFQRVFIAHALPGYLRTAFREDQVVHLEEAATTPSENDEGAESQEHVDADVNAAETGAHTTTSPDADVITPAEAVEYVLPLLNGLAMDDGACCIYLFHSRIFAGTSCRTRSRTR